MSANPLDNKAQAWSALFSEPMSELVKRYTASVGFDQRLWRADIDGSLAHAEMLAAQGIIGAQDLADIRRGMAQIVEEIEVRPLRVEARARGRAPEHRGAADAAGRRRRQAAAHRPQPQRPGGHRRAAVAARRDRRPGRAAGRHAARAGRAGRAARRDGDARLHAPAGGAAGELRAPPAGLRGDVRARCRAAGRPAPAHQPAAAGRGGAGRHQLPDGPRARGRVAGLRRRVPEQPGRRERPRLRARVRGLRVDLHGARVAPGRGDRAVDEPELRLHRPGRPLLHRLVDHAAEAQPRRGRTGARQDRPRGRPPDGAADADEGPAAGLQQGQPGRQGAAVRHRGHAARHAAHHGRDGGRHRRQARGDGARRAARAMPPPPTWPTTW